MANYNGTTGDDNYHGTSHADHFNMKQGGNDTVSGRAGADVFDFGGSLNISDKIDGGDGNDTLELSHGTGTILIGNHSLKSVENISLTDNGDYTITFLGAGGIGDHITMDGTGLAQNHFMTVDAGNEKTRTVTLLGGDGSDHLTGGQGDDELKGGKNVDYIDGEKGADSIVYSAVIQSFSNHFDEVTFKVTEDVFVFSTSVTGVDDKFKAKLNGTGTDKFDQNLENKVDASHLGAHHAVVLEVSIGDWSGHTFLIVDANGTAGYQGGADYVIDLKGNHLGDIDGGNFGT